MKMEHIIIIAQWKPKLNTQMFCEVNILCLHYLSPLDLMRLSGVILQNSLVNKISKKKIRSKDKGNVPSSKQFLLENIS